MQLRLIIFIVDVSRGNFMDPWRWKWERILPNKGNVDGLGLYPHSFLFSFYCFFLNKFLFYKKKLKKNINI
jgi:hypothetical protein